MRLCISLPVKPRGRVKGKGGICLFQGVKFWLIENASKTVDQRESFSLKQFYMVLECYKQFLSLRNLEYAMNTTGRVL